MAAVREPVPLPTVLGAVAGNHPGRFAGSRAAPAKASWPGSKHCGSAGYGSGGSGGRPGLSQMVIVVGLAAVASFLIPDYSFVNALRLLKFLFIILAGTFGAFGLMMGHGFSPSPTSLHSFGVPYMARLPLFAGKT